MRRSETRGSLRLTLVAAACAALMPAAVCAQADEGGVYIAGEGFTFQQVAERGLAMNPGKRRFFLLVLAPEADALMVDASGAVVAARERVVGSNGVLLVCQRDLDRGKVNAARLVPGVVAVRGWPEPGRSEDLPAGERYFKGEDASRLPASTEGLRRLRTACSDDQPAAPGRARSSR